MAIEIRSKFYSYLPVHDDRGPSYRTFWLLPRQEWSRRIDARLEFFYKSPLGNMKHAWCVARAIDRTREWSHYERPIMVHHRPSVTPTAALSLRPLPVHASYERADARFPSAYSGFSSSGHTIAMVVRDGSCCPRWYGPPSFNRKDKT